MADALRHCEDEMTEALAEIERDTALLDENAGWLGRAHSDEEKKRREEERNELIARIQNHKKVQRMRSDELERLKGFRKLKITQF